MVKKSFKIEDSSAEVGKLLDILNYKENDIAVILISTSFLDACLKTLLQEKFIHARTSSKLLENTLESFHTKSELCYSLGLIPKDMFSDLKLIAEIRNEIAHHYLQLSFDDDSIIKKCKQLETCKEYMNSPTKARQLAMSNFAVFQNQWAIANHCYHVFVLNYRTILYNQKYTQVGQTLITGFLPGNIGSTPNTLSF